MKRTALLFVLALALATVGAAPASAGRRDHDGGLRIRPFIEISLGCPTSAMLYVRIDDGLRCGGISRREARRLYRDVDRLEDLAWRYRRDGCMSDWERRELCERGRELARRISWDSRDGDGWDCGDRSCDHGRHGGWDRGDRGRDRDRWDNDRDRGRDDDGRGRRGKW